MKEKISKFAPGIFISLLGLIILIFGFSSDQNGIFLLSGLAIVVAGAITILNAVGYITNKTSVLVAIFLIVVSAYLGYENYRSIDEPIQFNKEKQIRYAEVIKNLKDLREIELAYKKENKVFCGNMDTLINFALYDSVTMVVMNGDVPDSLTEAQALEQGIIQRDTSLYPAFDIIFNADYMETRDQKYPLDINTLRFVPFSDNVDFKVEAGEITRSSGAKVQVFEITDAAPFDKNDVMKVGSMTDPTTAGNWKEEK